MERAEASSEGNSGVSWDGLDTRDACVHARSSSGSDVTPKVSRIRPWKPLHCITVSALKWPKN